MHENCHCFKFDDATLTQIIGVVITFALITTKQHNFSYLEDILIGKNNDFWVVGNCRKLLFVKFHAGTRKSPSEFWLPLLEQPKKFILSSDMQTFSLVNPDRIFGMDFDYNI